MDRATFEIEMSKSFTLSANTLREKADEYSDPEGNRLQQFYDAADDEGINPVDALVGMARKHWTSITHMARSAAHPEASPHSMKLWLEKTVDLRNYTILLEALLTDLGVE